MERSKGKGQRWETAEEAGHSLAMARQLPERRDMAAKRPLQRKQSKPRVQREEKSIPVVRDIVFQTIDTISKEAPPNRRSNEVQKVLQERSKDIKDALAAGWSASAIAKRLKTAGLMASVSSLRKEILLISGSPTRSRKGKEAQPPQLPEGTTTKDHGK
jgi:hypothetical protein